VLENVLSPEAAPDLFVFDRFDKLPMTERVKTIMKNPTEFIEYARRESHVVWRGVEAFIRKENKEGRDALIEGVAVLPELVSQLENIPHRAVFLGNQGENHKEHIKRFAEENEYDWMRDVSDQYIDAYAMYVKQMSIYIQQEAKKYGFEYIEMDKELFGIVTEQVMKSLGLSAS
jgi:2-phosphoglycerate kinase